MTRLRNPNRLHDLVETASKVFLAKGYRQTQVSDVARAMGVAPGTIYLYVESKEALFDLVIRWAVDSTLAAGDWELPVRRPDESVTLKFFRATLAREMRFPALAAAAKTESCDSPSQELESVVQELFRKTSKHWLALKLLERCAADWPELAHLWFGQHRPRVFALVVQYLKSRMAAGLLRPAPDAATAARLVIEMVAAFAMHCRADGHAPPMDQALAEAVVVDAIVNAYQPLNATQPKATRGSSRT